MSKKLIGIIVILVIIMSTGCTWEIKSTNIQGNENSNLGLTMKQKQEDAKYLMDNIVNRYPFFEIKKNLTGYDFKRKKVYCFEPFVLRNLYKKMTYPI